MPQSDGQYKIRPALILKALPKFTDFLVCGISSNLSQQIQGFDEIVSKNDDYFLATGLRRNSLIRLFFIGVKATHKILGTVGKIPAGLHKELLERLAKFLVS